MKRIRLIIFCLFLIPGLAVGATQSVSDTTAASAITKIRYYINEPVESTWSDTEILGWINDAQTDIVSRTQCLETKEQLALVAYQTEYLITSSYIAVTAVHYSPTDNVAKGLIRGHMSQTGHTGIQGTSEPNRWYEWNGKVGIYPVLTSVSTEKIRVFLVGAPTDLTSTGAVSYISTPRIYDHSVYLYAAAQAFLKTGQYAKSGRLLAEYYAELDRFRQDYVMRPKISKDTIRND